MALIIWFILCFCSGHIIFGHLWPKSWAKSNKHLGIGHRVLLIFLFIATVLSPLYYEFPNLWFSKVVTFDGDEVIEHPFGIFVLEFSNDYSNVPTGKIFITSGVTFTTENPTVRHLRYAVAYEIINMEVFFKERHRRHHPASTYQSSTPNDTKDLVAGTHSAVRREIEGLVAYQLLEFNNKFSKQLAQFYNPLDQRQQQEFKTLLNSYVNAGLVKDGIVVEAGRFTIK